MLDRISVLLTSVLVCVLGGTCVYQSSVDVAAQVGRPFIYALGTNVTIPSSMPSWLTTSVSAGDRTISLVGLPFICDTANSSLWTVVVCNSTPACQCIHIFTTKFPDKLQSSSYLYNRPILATLKMAFNDFSDVLRSPAERVRMWRQMRARMTGVGQSPEGPPAQTGNAWLLDGKSDFLSSIYVLAQANNEGNRTQTTHGGQSKLLFFTWEIGRGYLDDNALRVLSKVESRFKEVPDISDWMGLSECQAKTVMLDWTVGEYENLPKVRLKRQAPQGYQPIYPSRAAGAVSEASGITPPDLSGPLSLASNANAPLLAQPIVPVEITVQQISNIRIPPSTFQSPDGTKLRLRLFEHIYPVQFGMDFKDPSAATGREIGSDGSSWVSFDTANEILRLRPYPEHEGAHKFVLCAYSLANSRTCTNINVRVRPPTPTKKSFIIHVSPGIYWCYVLPIFWFTELKAESVSDVDISVTGEHFSWDKGKREICVVTKLHSEQIMAFFFRGINRASAEAVEVEFRIAVKVPPIEKVIASPRLRIRLRWPNTYNNYEMSEISRLNSSLAQALRVRVNPSVNAQNIFVYDVLQIRKFQEKEVSPLAKILELEFVYLPLGLPDAGYTDYWNVLDDTSSVSASKSRSPLSSPGTNKQFTRLKSVCEGARLPGSVGAIQAAAESFRPFQLESAAELELVGSACARLLQSTEGAAGTGKLYPGPLTATNVPYSDQVIENFTVEAGLAFKKRINPSKVVPLTRIRAIEIIDENYNRLNDTAWMTVAEDKTNLFGLPLQTHTRRDAYRFWLSIITVDQRTPINIHFTVDVVKWPLEMTSVPTRYGWFSPPNIVHNHCVRMRMKLGGTAGRGISPTYSWPPASPETSLSYRWNLVTSLDKYLRPQCGPHCGVGIMLMDIRRQDHSVIQVEWALLPLLQEGLGDVTASAKNTCPQRSIEDLQRKLLKVPLYHRYSSPSSSVSSPHQEYFSENDLRQASWSAPAPQLVEHLDWARLGTTAVVAVDLIGSCFSPYWRGESGGRTANFLALVNITTYIGETFRHPLTTETACFQSPSPSARLFDKDSIEVNETSWLSLEANKCALFGVAMKAMVSAGVHEFRILASPGSLPLSRVIINVGDRNPRLPEVPNHRVLMRFEPGYAVRSDPRTHMLQTLSKKWKFLVVLDEYLRPQCHKVEHYACANDMDLLLINIAPEGDGLNVIWAKKSIVYTPSLASNRSVSNRGYFNKQKLRLRQRQAAYGEIPAPHMSDSEHDLSCPWSELEKLTFRLQTEGPDFRVQPDLRQRFERAGFGRLVSVKVERLGHCSGQPKPFVHSSKHQPPNGQPDRSSQLSSPFDYLDGGVSNLPTTHSPNPRYPLETSKIFPSQADHQQATGTQSQQRAFLLTTLLPVCAVLVILLAVALAVVWFLKCRGGVSGRGRKLQGIENEGGGAGGIGDGEEVPPPERVPLKEDKKNVNKKNGLNVANNGNQVGNKTPRRSISHLKDMDSVPSPPSKPLILPNEKPPLKPPELMTPLAKATVEPSFQPRVASAGSPSARHFYAMGQRPDPYRNLPPPIDARFGLPRQITPQFGPYRRDPAV